MNKEVPPPLGAHCHTMRKAEDAARISISKESLAGEWIQSRTRYKIHSCTRTIPDVTQTVERTYVIIDEKETVFIMRASVLPLAKFWHRYNVRNCWIANLQSVDISCNGSSRKKFYHNPVIYGVIGHQGHLFTVCCTWFYLILSR